MAVLRFFARLFFGLLAFVGGAILLLLVAGIVAWQFLPRLESDVPQRAVLTFDIADGLVETRSASPLAFASFGRAVAMRDFVQALDAAGRDDRVRGIVMRLGGGPLGMARAQELRDAVAGLRGAGKFAIAFAETFGEGGNGNTHYYLATAFDQVWLQPSGGVDLTGALIESPYVAELLDDIGVVPRLDRRAEFKGAVDNFTATEMSAPVRANLQRLVDSWVDQIAAGIAETRGLDLPAARALVDRGPFLAAEAKAAGLVDRLGYWDEIDGEIDRLAGDDAETLALRGYIAGRAKPPADAPRIAVVYGLGPVQLGGDGGNEFFADLAMRSTVVAGALRKAVADEDVAAIVFRVDSPGGSYVAADTIWREVHRAREAGKPLVVSMGDTAASGGYFVAAPAEAIVAEPGTVTGSIGVFGGKFVLTGLWDEIGVRFDGVQAGANAGLGSANLDYSSAGWAHLQASLDRVYADFTGKVAAGRGLAPDRVEAAAKGQIWSGADARQRGLVDELGGLMTAVRRARTAAGIDPQAAVRIEEYPPASDAFDELLRDLLGDGLIDAGLGRAIAGLVRLSEALAPLTAVLAPLGEDPSARTLRMPELRQVN